MRVTACREAKQVEGKPLAGQFTLDPANKCLWDGDVRHNLAPKAFDVLDFLRRHPDRLVSHDDILDAVWPNTFVQPEIVKTYVRTLRRLLRDDARTPHFIETRPRSGYRFVGHLGERAGAPPAGERGSSTFVGRDAERAVVRCAFAAADRRSRGAVIFTGESGIGKSALLARATSELASSPGVVTAASYGCRSTIGLEPCSLGIALLQDLAVALGGHVLRDLAASRARSWLRYLDSDAGPHGDTCRDGIAVDPRMLVREACILLEQAARDVTVVLSIDDLQWADPASLALVTELMRRRYPARILLIAAYRRTQFLERCPVGDALADLSVQGIAQAVALSGLGEESGESMLRAMGPGDERTSAPGGRNPGQPAVDVGDIVLRSGGNPRLAKAFAAAEPTASDQRPGRHEACRRRYEAAYGSFDLQLSEFGPFLRSVLEAGSVAGSRFCAWAVATMLGKEQALIEDVTARLAASSQFLALDSWYSLPDGTTTPIYAFRHPSQRQFLLDSQAPSRRNERHRRFGQAIVNLWGGDVKEVAGDVSYCFSAAGDWSQAIGYARLAASTAVERSSVDEATRILTKALGLSSKLPAGERLAIQLPIREDLVKLGLRCDVEDPRLRS